MEEETKPIKAQRNYVGEIWDKLLLVAKDMGMILTDTLQVSTELRGMEIKLHTSFTLTGVLEEELQTKESELK